MRDNNDKLHWDAILAVIVFCAVIAILFFLGDLIIELLGMIFE